MTNHVESRALLEPVTVAGARLPNRVVMAPMTRSRAGAGGVPTSLMATYYGQRASAGLIVTEASQVSAQGVGYPGTPGIHSDEQVAGWREVTGAVHARGGRIALQLWHVGRISHPSLQPEGALPVAPSALRPDGSVYTASGPQPFVTPRALETGEIAEVVASFGAAARRALAAGFDAVEVHGANGYLVDQFLRDGSNQRTDGYGGARENRARFLLEVTRAVVDVWGPGRVGVRLSPTGTFNSMSDSDPEATFTYAARALAPLDLAWLHVVAPGALDAATAEHRIVQGIRQAFPGALILNGGFDAQGGEAVLRAGLGDLVAFGTLFLANPDLPERFAEDAPLNRPDPATFYGGDARGYTDYPFRRASAAA